MSSLEQMRHDREVEKVQEKLLLNFRQMFYREFYKGVSEGLNEWLVKYKKESFRNSLPFYLFPASLIILDIIFFLTRP